MADNDVERQRDPDAYRDDRRDRRTNWPLWLLVPLGIFGLVAVTQLGDRADDAAMRSRPTSMSVAYRGQTLSSAGAAAVRYPDGQMVKVGASDNGIELYKHRTQPWAGGGWGAGMPSTTDPLYMKMGDNTYLPLAPVARK